MANSQGMQDVEVARLDGGVGLLRLNRPDALNALRASLMEKLVTALADFDADPSIGVSVITGSDKAFSAGADIGEMVEASPLQIREREMLERWRRLAAIRKPIIAAVSGWCLGGGCELAMACDIIIASESAKFGQPEINVGIIPGAGGTQRLTKVVGKSLAMEMVLSGRRLSAEEALQCGLVSRIAPLDSYLDEAVEVATQIAAGPPLAVQMGKEAVLQAYELSLHDGIAFEGHLFTTLFASEDQKEGMRAFMEKRKPQWKGK